MTQDDTVVVFGAHHAACDGWSLDVLLADLGRLYSAWWAVHRSPTRRAFVGDYVRERASERSLQRIERARAFWSQTSRAASAADAPHDGNRPARRTFPAWHTLHAVSAPTLQAARQLSRERGLSLFTLLFSALPPFSIGCPVQRTW